MLYFHGTKHTHTHTEHHLVTLNHQHIRTCLGTWIMCICCQISSESARTLLSYAFCLLL